jgi:hypothetical protein
VDRHLVRLLCAGLLLATSLFVLRDFLGGSLPPGATGLSAAREAAGPWAEAVGAGRVPLWDPTPPAGPALAHPRAQPLHVLRLLHVPFGPAGGLAVLLVLELFLLGAGTFALARSLGRSDGASLLAALGVQLSPLVSGAAGDPAVFAALGFAPWPVVFAARISRNLAVRDAALAGALGAAVLLAGSVEIALATTAAAAVALGGGLSRGGVRLIALALLAGAVALLLSAPQWFPYLEARGAGLLPPSTAGSTPGLLDLFRVALPFGPVDVPVLDPWAAGHLLPTLYLGGPVLLLALARPKVAGERRLLTAAFVLAGIALAPVAASVIARLLPGLGVVDPVTLATPALLALPLLAAFGADALALGNAPGAFRRRPSSSGRTLAVVGWLLVALAVALGLFAVGVGLRLSAGIGWVLAGGVALVLFARELQGSRAFALPAALTALVAADLAVVQLLDPPLDRPAVAAAVPSPPPAEPRAVVAAAYEVVPRAVARARAESAAFDPRLAVLLEEEPPPPPAIPDPAEAADVPEATEAEATENETASAATTENAAPAESTTEKTEPEGGTVWSATAETRGLENADAETALATTTAAKTTAAGNAEAETAPAKATPSATTDAEPTPARTEPSETTDPGTAPAKETPSETSGAEAAPAEAMPAEIAAAGTAAADEAADPDREPSARITRDDPEEVHVLVDAPRGGWLLLADPWAPGWEAWVDGIRTEVLRANGSSRAVALPPGTYQVDFRYRPGSWTAGRWIGFAGILLLVFAVFGGRRARRRDRSGLAFP